MERYLRVHCVWGGDGCNSLDLRSDLCEMLPEQLENSSGLLSVGGKHIHSFRDFGKGGPSRAGSLVSRAGLSLSARQRFSTSSMLGFHRVRRRDKDLRAELPGAAPHPGGMRARS